MREIKFRQWMKNRFHHFEFTNGMCTGVANASLDEFPIMQYTGLKDKNGKEIYEGDVFGVTWSDGSIRPAWIVDWHKGYACWGFKSINRKSSIYRPLISEWKRKVVIGNIYENPDYLKPIEDLKTSIE